jgi:hypothetical protein
MTERYVCRSLNTGEKILSEVTFAVGNPENIAHYLDGGPSLGLILGFSGDVPALGQYIVDWSGILLAESAT